MERTVSALLDGAPLRPQHERIVDALGGPVAQEPPDLTQAFPLDVIETARNTWRGRMVNEHRSSAVFAGLLPQLIEASTLFDVQTSVARAAAEEIYHAQLCGDVVRAFGGEPVATAEPTLATLPKHEHLSRLEAVMRNVLFVGCLSETVAVALISAERDLCEQPFVRETFTRILADEIAHARLGWTFAAHALNQLEPAARDRTSGYLRTAFGYLERRECELLPTLPALSGSRARRFEAAGLCHGDDARALFHATVQTIIVPRLESLGLDARRAYRDRNVSASAA